MIQILKYFNIKKYLYFVKYIWKIHIIILNLFILCKKINLLFFILTKTKIIKTKIRIKIKIKIKIKHKKKKKYAGNAQLKLSTFITVKYKEDLKS